MSELPADSDVSQTDAASGNSDVPRAEVGGGRREPVPFLARPAGTRAAPMAEAGEGPMAAPGAAPMAEAREGPMAEAGEGPMAEAGEGPMAEAREGPMAEAGEGPMAAPGAAPMAEAREGPMAEARAGPMAAPREAQMAEVSRLLAEPAEEEGPEGRPRSGPENSPGGAAALPYLRLRPPVGAVGMNSQQFLRLSLDHRPLAPRRIQEPAERRRRLADACAARGAALDARYQRNPQRMDFDLLTFTVALTASEVINPLIEELGCDKFIPRE
ncbi:EP300-interacting inhibitor of differentiation 2-like [Equus quagga]|uniref:EP300-interacting inhibitor of differentiation 2-like n=1 Tax=Equus quagga TaxID=89248 RepID=UPI001EE3A075|nr:EP300-interacting inhibitor of differentiation 2-like [Equus quagga]